MSEQLTQEQLAQVEQARTQWVREQFQKANEYLASKGIIPDNVAVSESRYMPPFLAIWKMNAKDNKAFWVLSGDLPTDHMPISAALNAREAVRSFSLNWQLKAQQIINAGVTDKTQIEFANLLVHRAQAMYDMFEQDALWIADTAN